MTRLLTLALALAFAVISVVTVEHAPDVLNSPTVALAQISLPPMVELPTRFGGLAGGVLGGHK